MVKWLNGGGDHVLFEEDNKDMTYMVSKLLELYNKWELQKNPKTLNKWS